MISGGEFKKADFIDGLKTNYCNADPEKAHCEGKMKSYFDKSCNNVEASKQEACSVELEAAIKDSYNLTTPAVGFHTDDKYPTLADKILGPATGPGGNRTGGIAGKYASAKPVEPTPPDVPPSEPSSAWLPAWWPSWLRLRVGTSAGWDKPNAAVPNNESSSTSTQPTIHCDPNAWDCSDTTPQKPTEKEEENYEPHKSATYFWPRLHLGAEFQLTDHINLVPQVIYMFGFNDNSAGIGKSGDFLVLGGALGYRHDFKYVHLLGELGLEWGFPRMNLLNLNKPGVLDRGLDLGFTDHNMFNINARVAVGFKSVPIRLFLGLRTSIDSWNTGTGEDDVLYKGLGIDTGVFLGVEGVINEK